MARRVSKQSSPRILPSEPTDAASGFEGPSAAGVAEVINKGKGLSPVQFALRSPPARATGSPVPTAAIPDAELPPPVATTTTTVVTSRPVAKLTKQPRRASEKSSPRSASPKTSPPVRARVPSRGSTPDSHQGSPVLSYETLVADVSNARSRVILTKTHIIYPPPGIVPLERSVVLGFRGVFHPVHPSRIKDAEISIRFFSSDPNATSAPIIKAISPDSPDAPRPGTSSQVTKTTHLIGNISLGFIKAGELSLDAGEEKNATFNTSSTSFGSGVETSRALFTLNEDPSSHRGVDSFIDCAVLLQLPSDAADLSFEAEISVEADMHRGGATEALRKLIGSPRSWTLNFDGVTEFGAVHTKEAILTADTAVQTASERLSQAVGTSK